MSAPLRAVVIGAGWAGEGHTIGLRSAGVKVVGICARNASVVKGVADRLNIPVASIDWRATLHELKPDIISLATPAALREDVIQEALALGAHIVCEKPLAISATEAKRLLKAVEGTGIKHAYAATQAYDPTTSWIRELVRTEAIGRIKAVEIFAFVPMLHSNSPWTWTSDLSLGGGTLHNALTQYLGILTKVFGSDPIRVMGEARLDREKAPVLGEIHDYRQSFMIPSNEEVAAAEWKSVDADSSFNAIMEYCLPLGDSFTCVIQFDAMIPFSPTSPYFRIYGERGTIDAKGVFDYDISIVGPEGTIAKPLPDRFKEGYPDTGNGEQNKWNAFFREFVADVKGETYQVYPTFRQGYRDQRVIEAIRTGKGWTSVID
ncbi:Gfo/Idh/MocA family protein [Paenibacillus sp. sgz302251]|uniref:Gfo/Idh/MocA family protein n=1 Tax=Paenibacillus sp. sgz302251 TaxID=3414493 RepID=UPI003C7EADFC